MHWIPLIHIFLSARGSRLCKRVSCHPTAEKKPKISAKWDIPEGLKKAKVGKLILQPILENSIQHGGFSRGFCVFACGSKADGGYSLFA